jgi:hypothetical protein
MADLFLVQSGERRLAGLETLRNGIPADGRLATSNSWDTIR